eukprot:scaffold12249_cov49-Phaeocystis_antarctica.AAC.1
MAVELYAAFVERTGLQLSNADHPPVVELGVVEGGCTDLHERARLRQVEARELGVGEGGGTDLLERGRLRQVEARELGVGEGVGANRCDLRGDHERAPKPIVVTVAGDHERARKVSAREGAGPDLHERGRLREVEGRELGTDEGPSADGLDGRSHLERAREVRLALQEVIRDGPLWQDRRAPSTPPCCSERWRTSSRHRDKRDDEGNGVVGGRRGNDGRLGVGGRVLDVGWGLERGGHNHALEGGAVGGWDSATEPGLLEDEDGQGRGCEVAAQGEAEQASQTDQRLAVGARLAFGVLEGLALVGTDVHDDRTNLAVTVGVTRLEQHAAILRDGGCTHDPDHRGPPRQTHLLCGES